MRILSLLTLLGLAGTPLAEAEPAPATRSTPSADRLEISPEKARVMALFNNRTFSASKQFTIYSADAELRKQVRDLAEKVTTSLLKVLGEPDQWKNPVVITLEPAPAGGAPQRPVSFSVYQQEESFKIQIDVQIGIDPAQVNLQKHLVRALLIEMMYRDRPQALNAGAAYAEPPWWLVEGVLQMFRRQDLGIDTDLFKRIVDVNRLPAIGKFLAGQPGEFAGSAVETMDQACAMCLVQLLVEQPNGRANLATLIRHWPESATDPVANLLKEFPSLAKDEQSLQKWWTVNLARFSAADRYKGLTANETDRQLQDALRVEVAAADSAARLTFTLGEFANFLKLPNSRPALATCVAELTSLSTRASAPYRPLLAEYQEILTLLGRGKTRGLKERVAKVEEVRLRLHKQMNDVADYLNWYEATQTVTSSHKFDGYYKAAQELENPPPRQDPLSKFMDQVEQTQ